MNIELGERGTLRGRKDSPVDGQTELPCITRHLCLHLAFVCDGRPVGGSAQRDGT